MTSAADPAQRRLVTRGLVAGDLGDYAVSLSLAEAELRMLTGEVLAPVLIQCPAVELDISSHLVDLTI